MAKLKQPDMVIQSALASLLMMNPVNAFKRASELAAILDFNNINDCLHMAIAEVLH